MNWTEETYNRVKHLLPKQRGNVVIDNFTFLQAFAYINKHGCCWRGLPTNFGNRDTVYQRFRRWTEKGVFERIENYLQPQVIETKGVTKETSRIFTWSLPIVRSLSPGSAADDPEGQKLMETIPKDICNGKPLLMDKAYEGNACRKKARKCKMKPEVPPKNNRRYKRRDDKELYKHRNVVERYFCQIKEFRRICTRYDKLDETDNAFIALANIAIYLRN